MFFITPLPGRQHCVFWLSHSSFVQSDIVTVISREWLEQFG